MIRKFAVCLSFAAVVVSAPVTPASAYNMDAAVAYYRSQNWNGLLDYSRAWAAAEPNNERPWFTLGEAAIHLGNYEAAADGFRRSVAIKSNEPKAWNNLSAAYCKLQKWDLASKAIDDGEREAGSACGATDWYVFGNARKDLRDYGGAIADYRRALSMRPNFPEATNNLGVCQYYLGNRADARADYQRAGNQGDQAGRNNVAGMQAEADQAKRLQEIENDPNNVWNWARKSLKLKEKADEERKRMEGD